MLPIISWETLCLSRLIGYPGQPPSRQGLFIIYDSLALNRKLKQILRIIPCYSLQAHKSHYGSIGGEAWR